MSTKPPAEDPTSLGNLLLEWEVVTPEQLEAALEEQKTLRGDDLLGKLLIANGACSQEEIDIAMSAQASMRSSGGSKHKHAMACADIALARQRRDSLFIKQQNVIAQAEKVRRSITGEDHPAITPAMLAKTTSD